MNPLRRMLSLPDVNKRANEVAHHVMEEGVRANHEIDSLAGLLDLQGVNSPDRGLCLALGRTESREVVLANKERGGLAHLCRIQRKVEPSDVRRRERRAHRAVENLVAVSPRESAIARVEVARHF